MVGLRFNETADKGYLGCFNSSEKRVNPLVNSIGPANVHVRGSADRECLRVGHGNCFLGPSAKGG